MKRSVVAALAALILAPTAAAGDSLQRPTPAQGGSDMEREGFVIGFGLGAGSMVPSCRNCDSEHGIGLEFHIGGMLNPDVALLFDLSTVAAEFDDGTTLSHDIYTAAVQYWPASQFWLKGGLGFARLTATFRDIRLRSEYEPAVLLAGGFEAHQGSSFVLDLSLRLAAASYEDTSVTNVAAMLGFNWY